MSTIALALCCLQATAPRPLPIQGPGMGADSQSTPSPLTALTQPKIPELTPDQKAERMVSRLTSLEARIAQLRKVAGDTSDPNAGPAVAPPPATLEGIRDALNDLARELYRKGRPLELRTTADEVSEHLKARRPSLESFAPAPDAKTARPNVAPANTTPVPPAPVAAYPDADPSRVDEIVVSVAGSPIRRGEVESAIALRMRRIPGGSRTTAARLVLGQSLVPIAALRGTRAKEVDALLARAKALREEITSGKRTCEEVARAESTDKLGKAFGGLLDGVGPALFSDAELAALEKLKPGEISEPFLDANGVTILQLLEETKPDAGGAPVAPSTPIIKARRIRLGLDPGAEKTAEMEIPNASFEPFLPAAQPRKKK
jgi:PPIC-type PPIASE domain